MQSAQALVEVVYIRNWPTMHDGIKEVHSHDTHKRELCYKKEHKLEIELFFKRGQMKNKIVKGSRISASPSDIGILIQKNAILMENGITINTHNFAMTCSGFQHSDAV